MQSATSRRPQDLGPATAAPPQMGGPETRFRLLVENVVDYSIYMLDPSGYIVSWNTGAARMKGYHESEIIGKHYSIFFPEDAIREGHPQRELEIAAREGRFEEEAWRVRKDGSRFWALVVLTSIRDNSGTLIGFAKVTRDITERMQVQEALLQQIAEKIATQKKLQDSEQVLRQLSLNLMRLQDQERRRIGRELHDTLGQRLSVLKMRLDALQRMAGLAEQEGLRAEISESAKIVEDSIQEVRTLSYLLYPPMLEEMGLTSAIGWYLEGFSQRSGIEVTIETNEEFGRLRPELEMALFRVLQESLMNVHRHSGSRASHVRLWKDSHEAVLEIRDKGKGLSEEVLGEAGQEWIGSLGVGIRGMRERMQQLGGHLELISSEAGTTVLASAPLEDTCKTDGQTVLPLHT